MKGVINLIHWILSICLLIGTIVHINIFIHSTIIYLRFFKILILSALIPSSQHIFTITRKGKDVFSIKCSLNVRILQHFGLSIRAHTINKILFILSLIMNVIITCKKVFFYTLNKRNQMHIH